MLRKDINGNLLLRIMQSLQSFFTLSSQEARLIFVTQLILSSSSQHFLMVIQIFLLDIGCFSPHLQRSPCAWPLSCLQSYLTLTQNSSKHKMIHNGPYISDNFWHWFFRHFVFSSQSQKQKKKKSCFHLKSSEKEENFSSDPKKLLGSNVLTNVMKSPFFQALETMNEKLHRHSLFPFLYAKDDTV